MPGAVILLSGGKIMELFFLASAIAAGVIAAKTIKLYTNL